MTETPGIDIETFLALDIRAGVVTRAEPFPVNLPPRRIAGFRSEVLVLGVTDPEDPEDVVLVRPDHAGGRDLRGWRLA